MQSFLVVNDVSQLGLIGLRPMVFVAAAKSALLTIKQRLTAIFNDFSMQLGQSCVASFAEGLVSAFAIVTHAAVNGTKAQDRAAAIGGNEETR